MSHDHDTGSPRDAGPTYKGEPLDPDRGPGLGCFWIQIVLLAGLLVATPLSVALAVEPWISAVLLVATLIVLLFVGQTTIFLLRLVAADRRSRRRPLSDEARRTVGQLEDDAEPARPSGEGDDGVALNPDGGARPNGSAPRPDGGTRPGPSDRQDA